MSNRAVFITIIVSLIVIVVLAFVNRESVKLGKITFENAEIILKYNSNENILDFEHLSQLKEKEFSAIFDSSNTDSTLENYTGVLLYDILREQEADPDTIDKVIVRGIDGYTVALSMKEITEEDNVYLAYKHNGKLLKSKDKGGSGPYQLIVRKDRFSQRWCKFVVEIELR